MVLFLLFPYSCTGNILTMIFFRIMEISTPETVGREVVKGIQCEEEHVYIPRNLHVGLKMQAWVISPHLFYTS